MSLWELHPQQLSKEHINLLDGSANQGTIHPGKGAGTWETAMWTRFSPQEVNLPPVEVLKNHLWSRAICGQAWQRTSIITATQEAGAGGWQVQGQSWIWSEFKGSPGDQRISRLLSQEKGRAENAAQWENAGLASTKPSAQSPVQRGGVATALSRRHLQPFVVLFLDRGFSQPHPWMSSLFHDSLGGF